MNCDHCESMRKVLRQVRGLRQNISHLESTIGDAAIILWRFDEIERITKEQIGETTVESTAE